MPIPFRQRLFLGLIGLGTLPLAAALVVLTLQMRTSDGTAGIRAALDEIAGSAGDLVAALDTAGMSAARRDALERHTATISSRTGLARRAEMLSRSATQLLVASVALTAVLLLVVSVWVARRWASEVSAPVDELVAWIGSIRDRDPLPPEDRQGWAPEFAALRSALRQMADDQELARARELERERLMAFREVARRVAHEIRGPLTSSRLALAHLEGVPLDGLGSQSIMVLNDEVDRLDRMAREFTEFGRLPAGPEAPVDLVALIRDVAGASVPDTVRLEVDVPDSVSIDGYYEPLRRAVQNLIRNAVESPSKTLVLTVTPLESPRAVRVAVADSGPGVSDAVRGRLFEPYYTTKAGGTGLGLAIVRQTVEAHGGSVAVGCTPGGGATFVMQFPRK